MIRIVTTALAIGLLLAPRHWADDLALMKKYEYGGDQACLLAVERAAEDAMDDPAKQAEMARRLLGVMTDEGASLAAKQHAGIFLRICGTEAEVPALAAMLGNEKIGDFARGALERIPAVAALKQYKFRIVRKQD